MGFIFNSLYPFQYPFQSFVPSFLRLCRLMLAIKCIAGHHLSCYTLPNLLPVWLNGTGPIPPFFIPLVKVTNWASLLWDHWLNHQKPTCILIYLHFPRSQLEIFAREIDGQLAGEDI